MNADCRQVNIIPKVPQPQKNCKILFIGGFIRLGLVYNILTVGQNRNMGKCQISKMTAFGLQVIFHLCVKH